jgi:hypothetical protein
MYSTNAVSCLSKPPPRLSQLAIVEQVRCGPFVAATRKISCALGKGGIRDDSICAQMVAAGCLRSGFPPG